MSNTTRIAEINTEIQELEDRLNAADDGAQACRLRLMLESRRAELFHMQRETSKA